MMNGRKVNHWMVVMFAATVACLIGMMAIALVRHVAALLGW